MEKSKAVGEVYEEFTRAQRKFPPFASAHEGYAVLLEEVDELWREITLKTRSVDAMRAEAIQVAAMALRFLHDIC